MPPTVTAMQPLLQQYQAQSEVEMGNKKCRYGFHNHTSTIPEPFPHPFISSGEVVGLCFQPARRGAGMTYTNRSILSALRHASSRIVGPLFVFGQKLLFGLIPNSY